MHSGKSVMELPLSKRTRTCIGDQHDRLQYSTEHEALISLANDMFGLYTWSHTVTQQNIDYIDCDSNKYSVGVVAFVKVELKNGIYHQDVGYGICSNSCCKGYAIACARKEAAANGLRETLRSFGCDVTRKVNEPTDMPVGSSGFKTSLQMNKHSLDTAVTNSSRLSADASPSVCLPSSDVLKQDRKRRQQHEQEELHEQIKDKQLTNSRDLQSESLVDKNTGHVGAIHCEEKGSDFIDDETLISTQELDRLVQSAEVQQSRRPLVCSPPKITVQATPPWPAARGSKVLGNRVMPRQLPMTCRRAQV
uniref:Putative DNA repair protein RAD52-like protein n=1 Tax=Reticulitermes speratus TaxID=60591 RepID=A0A2Z5U624_9NEOP